MPYARKLEKKAKAKGVTVRRLIEDAIAAEGGSMFQAAITLEVYPNALRYHLSKSAECETPAEPVEAAAT